MTFPLVINKHTEYKQRVHTPKVATVFKVPNLSSESVQCEHSPLSVMIYWHNQLYNQREKALLITLAYSVRLIGRDRVG